VLDEAREARNWLVSLETREKEKTGIKSLKVGYNKVFGYYIEISHANTALVPPEYRRKQTLANAERYVTQELEERERIVLQSEERFQQLERDRYAQLLLELERWVADLREAAVIVAELDVAAALADIAIRSRWVRPVLCTDPILKITGGRHPMVEAGLPSGAFIPNDTLLDHEGCQIALITGPNMAGKSTYLRQTALIVLLAQIGSFVPAESACVGIVDRIFTRVGAHDDLFSGQSTFMVEMLELGHMLHHATPHSLLILDEIGRGTSTYDGLAIAQATIEYLHHEPHVQCRTLFATHYQELTALADVLPRLRNFSVAVEEVGERVVFLHKIVPGSADRSYGIHVARLAGVPRALTRRAQEILGNLEHQAGIRERRGRVRQLRGEIHDALQLSILTPPDPLVEELAHLDIMTMSPLEALQQLFALHEQAVKRLKPS
jgi:DNA mismatch repair protein MutS